MKKFNEFHKINEDFGTTDHMAGIDDDHRSEHSPSQITELEVINLNDVGVSSEAPKEWSEIPEIAEQRPSNKPGPDWKESRLQQIDGTDVCVWMVKIGGHWKESSDLFHVSR